MNCSEVKTSLTPEQCQENREQQARVSMSIGYLKLLSSAMHYAWCVRASLEANALGTKAIGEIKQAIAHLNEAAFIVDRIGGTKR